MGMLYCEYSNGKFSSICIGNKAVFIAQNISKKLPIWANFCELWAYIPTSTIAVAAIYMIILA